MAFEGTTKEWGKGMDKKWPIPKEKAASIIISELSKKNKKIIADTPKGLQGTAD